MYIIEYDEFHSPAVIVRKKHWQRQQRRPVVSLAYRHDLGQALLCNIAYFILFFKQHLHSSRSATTSLEGYLVAVPLVAMADIRRRWVLTFDVPITDSKNHSLKQEQTKTRQATAKPESTDVAVGDSVAGNNTRCIGMTFVDTSKRCRVVPASAGACSMFTITAASAGGRNRHPVQWGSHEPEAIQYVASFYWWV